MIKNREKFPFSLGNLIAFLLLYLIAGVILFIRIGPWEAVRQTVVNGAIVLAWLGISAWILKNEPLPDPVSIRRPRLELAWGLLTFLIVVLLAAFAYLDLLEQASWLFFVVFYAFPILLYVTLRYPLRAIGLVWPSRRTRFALMAVIMVNLLATLVYMWIPSGEADPVPGADLAEQITGPWSVLMVLLALTFRAALPEELLFRVTLQPRLARFIPLGWAILLQALLFNLGHFPQQLIRNQEPVLLASAYLMTIDNGIISGYLWYRTRSLPLLIVLHLFAYPRFGV